ncbi:hypothetical protein V1289_001298 [Bradyrhizobium sp. AZCC 2289]
MVSFSPTTAAARLCVHIKAVQKAGFNGLVEGGKIAFRRRARSEDWKHLPEVLGDGKMRGALSSAGRRDAVQSTRHQIIIAAQNALDVECGASRGVGIRSARGQHT